MLEKVIEFSAHEDYYSLKEDHPIPIKLNIPDWYKELDHTIDIMTVKGCMPFLDSLTTGYLLKVPQDIRIRHNVLNEETGQQDTFIAPCLQKRSDMIFAKGININAKLEIHPTIQLGKSPYVEKNKNLPFHKIMNPWTIKTPKGYSCLFLPPLNNTDDRFSIMPGIVDTDEFDLEVNFPILINGDKYSTLDTIIKKGTPYVQVIPFKRDNWKMKVVSKDNKTRFRKNLFLDLNFLHNYKNKFWKKKSWK